MRAFWFSPLHNGGSNMVMKCSEITVKAKRSRMCISNSDKNDLIRTGELNRIIDNTSNKNNVTFEQNARAGYFIFPSQETLFNQNLI